MKNKMVNIMLPMSKIIKKTVDGVPFEQLVIVIVMKVYE